MTDLPNCLFNVRFDDAMLGGPVKANHFVCIFLLLLATLALAQNPVPFVNQPLVPTSAVPGTNCAIGVFFDPTVSGARIGTLTVTDNATNNPQTVSLNGTGQDFSMALQSQSSATVSPGQSANYMIAVTPVGGFNQTVALSCSGAPPGAICSVPNSVALNGSAPTPVSVTVTTATSASLARPNGFYGESARFAALLGLCGMPGVVVLGGLGQKRGKRRLLLGLAFFCLLTMIGGMSACGGGSDTTTGGATTYSLTVTGTFTSGSTTLTHDAKLALVVQ
jgi:hypothetical protein